MAETSERRARRLVLNVNNAAKFIVGQAKSIQGTVTVVSEINLKRRLEQSQDASIIY